ncbi:Nodule Cysteine-Rich (NCR) secreted peptide [Medicago truncatula]|uniref:Nodule Cysteine-Rich (NCR) secreted peptide n=1 Tax=Medicago truncatula TaxID=3880 RepID=A0A072UEN9_MEDTR|nr:Nodule Cysteine-Rich (NCR) secreted peptide [Medicago truncatula]
MTLNVQMIVVHMNKRSVFCMLATALNSLTWQRLL